MEIICGRCGAVIPDPEWKTIRDGDIEHTCFLCPSCGEAYRVSTTDGKLRGNIEKYTQMAARLKKGKCSEQLFQLIIDIAALCSGDDNWQSTRALLAEAGVPVPEEVNSVRLTLDKLMDTDFPRLNRE